MTALQESARKSFEAWKKTGSCFYLSRNNAPGSDLDGYQDAYTQGQWVAWQAALEQHEADKPFQPDWTNYRQGVEDGKAEALAQQELPQKARPDFMAGYDAGMADAKRMAQQGEPVAQARLGMKDGLAMALSVVELYGMKGDVIYREIAKLRDGIAAAPAPQPAQEPVKFLVNGTRFKLSFDTRGRVSSLWNFMDELDGRWVALVAAEDDCHLQSAQPVAQPRELTDEEIGMCFRSVFPAGGVIFTNGATEFARSVLKKARE